MSLFHKIISNSILTISIGTGIIGIIDFHLTHKKRRIFIWSILSITFIICFFFYKDANKENSINVSRSPESSNEIKIESDSFINIGEISQSNKKKTVLADSLNNVNSITVSGSSFTNSGRIIQSNN